MSEQTAPNQGSSGEHALPWKVAKGSVHKVLNELAAIHIPTVRQSGPGAGQVADRCRECSDPWPCRSREHIDEMRRLLPGLKQLDNTRDGAS